MSNVRNQHNYHLGMKNPYSHAETFIAQLKSVEQQINQNQLPEAAQQLNRLVKTAPHDPRLFLLGSRLAEAAGNHEGMLQAARKAHQLAPQWPAAIMHLAGVLGSRDEADEALTLAAQAVQQATTDGALDSELLKTAATLAQRLAQHTSALVWLRQAEQMNPADSGTRYKIGLSLSASGDFAGAIEVFTSLLAQLPDNPSILSARLQAGLRGQQLALAVQDAEALLALDPTNEEIRFYLAVARGETPPTQPASMISGLFNASADRFDRQMVGQLQYNLPRIVGQKIHEWHPDRKGDVLDLGCGTGLLGVCLGPIEGVLVGVDLSSEMIGQAARHNVYDSFHQVNVLDALQATPAGLYHVITALDVFNYVGDLGPVLPNAYRILLPGGRLVFSCEAGAQGGADYALLHTYRYTHQRSYVQRLLAEAGFKDIEMEDRVLRFEAEQPVPGFLVTARKQPQAPEKTGLRKRALKNPQPASS